MFCEGCRIVLGEGLGSLCDDCLLRSHRMPFPISQALAEEAQYRVRLQELVSRKTPGVLLES